MKNLCYTIITLLLLSFTKANAQKEITVTGKVIDKDINLPLEYATIAFFNKEENRIETGGITDLEGNFSIDVPKGTYDITVEYISYKTETIPNKTLSTDIDLGILKIGISAQALGEVQIIAERTTVEIQLDKKIYNIGSDLTTAGGTVSDALNNVPSVSVDIEGGISLRGNENVRILINGKPSAMAGFGDTNVLSQLPAEAIERVEVITSPSARYDAEGTAGILNIILRQKETLGFNGSLTLNAGNPDNYGLNTNLNLRKEKFNLFTNIGFRYFDAPRNSFSDANYFDRIVNDTLREPEFERIREDEEVSRLNRNYNANLGMEYFINDNSSITGSVFYRYGQDADLGLNNSDRFNMGSIVEQTLRREKETKEDNRYQISLNYINRFDDEGQQLTADIQYGGNKEIRETGISENYLTTQQINPDPFQREEIFSTEKQIEYLLQADYVLPLGEDARFEAGFRDNYENQNTDYNLNQENISTGNLILNDTLSNIFDYTEHVTAIYSQYGTRLGKFSFLLGLRLENTRLKGDIDSRLSDQELIDAFGFPIQTKFDNNYLGLFPTVNLIYNLANEDEEEESVTLGYNRRINRPRGWYINPFPSRTSRTSVFQGNPNLQPAFSNAFDLGYLKRWEDLTLTTSIYYQHETGSFERIEENAGQQTTEGIDIIRRIPVNLSTNDRIGAEIGILYSPTKWLRLNSSFNFFQFETEGEFNGVDYGAKNTSYFTRFSSKVTLPAKIDWQTNIFYSGPQENAQTRNEGIFSMDLAFSKEIFKDQATVSLNVRDVFNSRKSNTFTTTESFNRSRESQWRQRQITLSLLLRFNQQKKEQRDRQNGGDDNEFEG